MGQTISLDKTNPATIQDRKADHLRICLEDDVQCHQTTTGLENYRFIHCGLP
ncbi:MAG: type 2 isopentenyl-diphosphate Delta-isomerase, partial [Cyanobacteria bacterium J06636_28]